MKDILSIFLIGCFLNTGFAQDKNSIWAFGDSAGIDFSVLATPIAFPTSFDTRGTCVSVADSNGLLQFYANSRANLGGITGLIWNKEHNLMLNGDSIISEAWYHEMAILPFPDNDSMYYLFSIGVTINYGLYYSVINMNLDSGRGAVVQKNIQLQSFPVADCLAAVKHGNGRDWWLIFRRWDDVNLDPTDTFYFYMVSPAGINNFHQQTIGSLSYSNAGCITFSKDGNKFVYSNLADLIELYDFDRCSGLITGFQNIDSGDTLPPYKLVWSNAFSPDESKLYVSTSGGYSATSPDTSYLFQYDLNAADIQASRISLDTFYHPVMGGALKLGPNDKIYFSCAWDWSGGYPYPDTVYNPVNTNLSVINYPDSLGNACGYSPFSFFLTGKRTYYGLPNNPDYELDALTGSPCDTLTSVADVETGNAGEMFVFHHTGWQKLFINAHNLRGKKYVLRLYSLLGSMIYEEEGNLQPPYFTREVDTGKFAQGLFIVSLITDKEKLSRKFVK
jgi:hypothetical protein